MFASKAREVSIIAIIAGRADARLFEEPLANVALVRMDWLDGPKRTESVVADFHQIAKRLGPLQPMAIFEPAWSDDASGQRSPTEVPDRA